jgi:hypothetical protein
MVPSHQQSVAPDQAQSVVPPAPVEPMATTLHNCEQKKGRSRQEIAEELPTAAELLDVFEDESMPGQRAYYEEVRSFLASVPKGNDESDDAYSTANRSQLMDNMSACSWIRSVKSVGSDGGGTMLMSIVGSLLNSASSNEEQSSNRRPKMPQKLEIATRSQKMSNFGKTKNIGRSNTSNVSDITEFSSFRDKSLRSTKMSTDRGSNAVNTSFMSDLTDFSSFRETNNKSQRSSKMEAAGKRENSNYSMLSELTDISEGFQDMFVAR